MTINCKGELIDLSTPKVMGVLNLTPDSFYDGGRHTEMDGIVAHVSTMLEQGATFIDVGAYSSRPGADHVSEADELKRLTPVIDTLLQHFPDVLLSIDTFRSRVADVCLDKGAALINDISGGLQDDGMFDVVARYGVPIVVMHMRGTPKTMQSKTQYDDLISEMNFYFSERIEVATRAGINDIILDPGFGFAKTLDQNYALLNALECLHLNARPLLVGMSRKSMLYKLLDTDPDHALNATTAVNTMALLKGAHILRVHDVAEAVECVKIVTKTKLS